MYQHPLSPRPSRRHVLLSLALSALLVQPAQIVLAAPKVIAPEGTGVGLPFSPGMASEDFLFLSGALGNVPGTLAVLGNPAEQTARTFAHLDAVLEAAGLDRSRLVATSIYVSDARLYGAVGRTVKQEVGGAEVQPTRVSVEAAIALRDAVVEISAIAAQPGVPITAITPEGWQQPTNGYSWGVLAGDTLFISGQAGGDARTGTIANGIVAQTRKALENVGAVLKAADMSYENLVSCRVFLSDARDYVAMNETYATFFEDVAPPARATVEARSINPAMLVQIACDAARGAGRKVIVAAGESLPDRPYSPAIQVGDRLFLSGFVGRGPDGYPADVEAQTQITLDRLAATLKAAGMSFADVERSTVFLTDIRHYDKMNAVYGAAMPTPPPARATVGTKLAGPDALVEIQMVASRKDDSGTK